MALPAQMPARNSLSAPARGCSVTWEATACRTPWSPRARAISMVTEPMQWAMICTDSAPLTSRTFATAAG